MVEILEQQLGDMIFKINHENLDAQQFPSVNQLKGHFIILIHIYMIIIITNISYKLCI
jgi:hypothetical protein